jgi:hypothetical protein
MRNGLKEVPYQSEVWRRRFPLLANILEDEPGLPKRNLVRRNVMVRCGGMSLATEAKQQGTFGDNWETTDDPGFVDATHLNYALRTGALAYQKAPGFQPIPFDEIGLRKDAYRAFLPAPAPWIEPQETGFLGDFEVKLGCRTRDAVIRYTLDGSAPTPQSRRYTTPIRLTKTTTVRAAAFASTGEAASRSDTVTATFKALALGPDHGVHLSDLTPLEAFVHGGLKRDTSYEGNLITLRGREFPKGLLTHPGTTPQGGRATVVYALEGGLAKAKRFVAWVGIDDSAASAGSCVFIVEVRRKGEWQRLFASAVLRGGQPGQPVAVDVDISGADRLRLTVTDAGDNINSDHAAWGGAMLQ